jgi:hypothetical protein
MLIGKLFHIGYTPRGSVVVGASARLIRPDPVPGRSSATTPRARKREPQRMLPLPEPMYAMIGAGAVQITRRVTSGDG